MTCRRHPSESILAWAINRGAPLEWRKQTDSSGRSLIRVVSVSATKAFARGDYGPSFGHRIATSSVTVFLLGHEHHFSFLVFDPDAMVLPDTVTWFNSRTVDSDMQLHGMPGIDVQSLVDQVHNLSKSRGTPWEHCSVRDILYVQNVDIAGGNCAINVVVSVCRLMRMLHEGLTRVRHASYHDERQNHLSDLVNIGATENLVDARVELKRALAELKKRAQNKQKAQEAATQAEPAAQEAATQAEPAAQEAAAQEAQEDTSG